MKLTMKIIASVFLFCGSYNLLAQSFSESRSVRGYATINDTTETITLHWNTTPNTSEFKLYRRSLTSNDWGNPVATLPAATDMYTDATTQKNEVYEYAIERLTSTNDRYSSGNILGYAYLSASIEAPAVHERGILWVLITQLINDSLPNEIATLTNDLVADGWNVYNEVINPAATPTDIKEFIKSKQSTVGCDAVYLLGHLPVPYSGIYCEDEEYAFPPDGHNQADPNSHCGAWPADAFYGDLEGNWTDEDSTSLAKRSENNNAIGDGKYDQHRIPGKVTIAVGRVDMSNLPLFSMSEVALTKRYLDKVHLFKTGSTPLINKGVIENNFASFDEGFSSAAIRDFYAVCGDSAVVEEDILQSCKETDYLLSYVCGGGSYTSCNGFGTSDSFKNGNMAAFNHLFGSFFGDWDIQNNLLRSSLATKRLGYSAIWSGRPKWVTHTLALGESYADITRRSQNNFLDYDANFYQNGAHMALLGDPSLRLHAIKPAKNILLATTDSRDQTMVSWEATDEANTLGYYVYRSHRRTGKYIPINTVLITGTEFIDTSPYAGTNHYMVRAAKKQLTGSGSYINLSLGIHAEINEMKGETAALKEFALSAIKVYPTVTQTTLTLEQELPKATDYKIYSTMGIELVTGRLTTKKTVIDVSNLRSGAYFIKTEGGTSRFIRY